MRELTQCVADDAILRPPPDGMTVGVRCTSFGLVQLYLQAARKDTYVHKVAGAIAKHASVVLHAAYLAIAFFGYDRELI